MIETGYRGVVRDGIVLLEKETGLRDGTEVLVTPIPPAGRSAAVLAAMGEEPHVPSEWLDELEQLIAGGRRVPSKLDVFPDEKTTEQGR